MTDNVAAWWKTAVVYEAYPRSFADSNGDGIGDLRGATSKLDYLAHTLGVDAIWFGPFTRSPQVDFGYDVSDYTDVDPSFGTLADAEAFIAAAHARNIKVITDLVVNHTSDQHLWFLESRSSRTNPKRDWYVWADPKPDGSPPSNWTSEQGGSTWEFDDQTGQYFLHSFNRAQPDLNWRNPQLRAAMLDAMRFWLDRGIDGFRIDVLHLIAKNPQFTDNPQRPNPEPNPTDRQHPDYDTQWHVYDRMHPDLFEYVGEIRQVLDEYTRTTGRERIAIGEIEAMPWDRWAQFLAKNGLHHVYNFNVIEAPWNGAALRASIAGQEAALPTGSWPNYVLSNLDRPRLATRNGPHSVRLAAMLLLTLRGMPTLYYGDELGLPDLAIPPEKWQDILGRDQNRGPMPWTASGHGGFDSSPVDAAPWLATSREYLAQGVETQLADPESVLNLYRRLLALRRSNPALVHGDYQPLETDTTDVLAYRRQAHGHTVAVALNLGARTAQIRLPEPGRGLVGTHSVDVPRERLDKFELPPHHGLVLELEGKA